MPSIMERKQKSEKGYLRTSIPENPLLSTIRLLRNPTILLRLRQIPDAPAPAYFGCSCTCLLSNPIGGRFRATIERETTNNQKKAILKPSEYQKKNPPLRKVTRLRRNSYNSAPTSPNSANCGALFFPVLNAQFPRPPRPPGNSISICPGFTNSSNISP